MAISIAQRVSIQNVSHSCKKSRHSAWYKRIYAYKNQIKQSIKVVDIRIYRRPGKIYRSSCNLHYSTMRVCRVYRRPWRKPTSYIQKDKLTSLWIRTTKSSLEVVDMWEGRTRQIYSQLFCILPRVDVESIGIVEEIDFSICIYKQINLYHYLIESCMYTTTRSTAAHVEYGRLPFVRNHISTDNTEYNVVRVFQEDLYSVS